MKLVNSGAFGSVYMVGAGVQVATVAGNVTVVTATRPLILGCLRAFNKTVKKLLLEEGLSAWHFDSADRKFIAYRSNTMTSAMKAPLPQ